MFSETSWLSRLVLGLVCIIVIFFVYFYWLTTQYNTKISTYLDTNTAQQYQIELLNEKLDAVNSEYLTLRQDADENRMLLDDKTGEVKQLTSKLAISERRLRNEKAVSKNLRYRYQQDLSQELAQERKVLSTKMALYDAELMKLRLKEATISSRIDDVNEWKKKLNEFEKLYSASALQVQNEERISMLMGQFNQLRVDLDVINICDKNYLYRYNEAKSILNHIRTFIQKYEMKDDFYFYVIANDSLISNQNRKLCFAE